MKSFELKGEIREGFGKKAAKEYRSKDMIPCVIYGGNGNENTSFLVKSSDVRNLIYTPEVFIVDLNLGDKSLKGILKDVQYHPIKEQILHIDFLRVDENVPMVIEIPVKLQGLAAGVKAGGKLSMDMRKLRVRGLAKDMPEQLTINVEKLKLGKSIQVGELNFENLELLNAKDAVVARVALTRAARGEAAKAGAGSDDEEDENSEE